MEDKSSTLIIIFTLIVVLIIFAVINLSNQQSSPDVQLSLNSENQTNTSPVQPAQTTSSSASQPVTGPIGPTKPETVKPISGKYNVTLNTTAGKIVIQLDVSKTPNATKNFLILANKGFYNNTIFHRVIKGFMIQGGDPTGTGRGGPGYTFADELFEGEYTRGAVVMANAGPNTNGSQFFIMQKDTPLSKNYVIFGKVVEGIETVDKIADAPVKASESGEVSQPANPIKIISVDIAEVK